LNLLMHKLNFTSDRRAGLECGASGAKLVLLRKRDSDFQVEHVFIEDYLFESRIKGKTLSPLDIVRRLLIHKNLAGYQFVFTAKNAVESCFAILPKMNKTEMEGAVKLQAIKLLSWENARPNVAYISSEFLSNRTGNLIGLADWNSVKPWCRLIENTGGEVKDLTLEACAYQALARRQAWFSESPVLIVADVSAESTLIYIFDAQTVRFMRKIPVGGDAITKMLTTEISTDSGPIRLTEIEAEDVKITGCLPLDEHSRKNLSPDLVSSAMADSMKAGNTDAGHNKSQLEHIDMLVRPAVERISSEIARSIQFYRDNTGQKVDAVYITGGTSCLPSLKTQLESSLKLLPVKLVNPFAGFNFTDISTRNYAEKNKARLALAVGLALIDEPEISLMPKYANILKKFAKFMPSVVLALLLLAFLPFAVGGTCHAIKIKTMRTTIKQYSEQAGRVDEERRHLETLQQQFQESSHHYAALQQMIGNYPLWSGIFNSLAGAIPANIVLTHFSVKFGHIETDVIMLEGDVLPSSVGFDDVLAAFLSSLSASPFFKQVNIINAQTSQTANKLGSFEIQCELIH